MRKAKGNLFQNQRMKSDLKARALPELLAAGKLEEAITYLKNGESETEAAWGQYCENEYLNAVCSYYFWKLQELETVLKLDIQIRDEKLPYKELCQILANGLENACNASRLQAAGEREVSVQVKCSRDCLILRIKNRCGDNSSAKKGTVPKSRGAGHGTQLSAVQETVEKLGGVMLCYTESVNFVLDVLVRIKH